MLDQTLIIIDQASMSFYKFGLFESPINHE